MTFSGVDELEGFLGKRLGETAWEELRFDRIEKFADATDDHQWIHIDRERIAKESPYKVPIAHGYCTLSLVAGRFLHLVEVQSVDMVINYGVNKVRFPNALREGDRFRLAVEPLSVTAKGEGWFETVFIAIIEIEGADKPACVAECVMRMHERD
ncbi:MAG: MaoC family dehydratase [Myxococcota bacterium]